MTWIKIMESLGGLSGFGVTFAANLLIQSSVLIAIGLMLSRWLRSKGAAVQSVVLRATLVAAILCPLAIVVLNSTGIPTLSITLPQPVFSESEQPPPAMQSEAAELNYGRS